MSQYERIRPIVFSKAPEVKQVRSNSLAVRSSPSKKQLETSFELQVPQNNNNALHDISNFKKLFISESCHNNNKENTNNSKKFSFKMEETQFLKQRIQQLEQQNTNYIAENKKLAHVLDQQIQLNQSLQEQHQSKNQIIRKLEDISSNQDLKQINEQLIIYKKVVGDLEDKVQIILQENKKLSEINERFAFQEQQFKTEIDKYKTKCQILESKWKQIQSDKDDSKYLDFQRKIKKQSDQIECLNRENQVLKQHIHQQQIEPNFNQQNTIMDKNKETIEELEYENKYLSSMMQIDQQKMNNLEEKLNLLTKENARLLEIVKNRHK